MVIRNFKKEDVPEVMKLVKEMVDHHYELDPHYKPWNKYKDLKNHVIRWLKERGTKTLVAEEGGEIIGYARGSVEKSPSYLASQNIGIIYDLLVSSHYRKQGIGGFLFDSLMDWFKTKKIGNIELKVDARNASGVAFWKKLGFKEYSLRMRLDL